MNISEKREARSKKFITKAILLLGAVLYFSHLASRFSLLYAAPGKATANYLKGDVGAKGVALAGTQFGSENDSFASFYNPALLSGISQKEFVFMHSEYIEDLRQEAFTFVNPTNERGSFALAANYFTS